MYSVLSFFKALLPKWIMNHVGNLQLGVDCIVFWIQVEFQAQIKVQTQRKSKAV